LTTDRDARRAPVTARQCNDGKNCEMELRQMRFTVAHLEITFCFLEIY
jgi:hypothetical protein